MLHNIERIGEQAIRKGVIYEEVRDSEEMRIVRILDPIALKGAQIIDIAELRTQLLQDSPVELLPLVPDLVILMTLKIGSVRIVNKQRIVHTVEKADELN